MIGKRDDASYVEFVTARRTHLRRVAYALCGDWYQADDLVQIALTKLYVAWPRVHRDGREEAYARQILVRSNIDDSRRPVHREKPGLPDDDRPGRELLPVEERTALFDALQELPEMQRKAVVLRHWLGLTIAETAAELQIGEGTVKSHTSRALEKLQEVLADLPS